MNLKSNKAITLVALIITIIILLVLAGVTLSMVLGDNGVIDKAQSSVDKYQESGKNESDFVNEVDNYLFDFYAKNIDKVPPELNNYWWGMATSDGVSLYIQATDDSKIDQLQCFAATEDELYENWILFDAVWDEEANAYRVDINKESFGPTHDATNYKAKIYLYDLAGNGGFSCETSTVYIPHVHTTDCYKTVTTYGTWVGTGNHGFKCNLCGACAYYSSTVDWGKVHCSRNTQQLICTK